MSNIVDFHPDVVLRPTAVEIFAQSLMWLRQGNTLAVLSYNALCTISRKVDLKSQFDIREREIGELSIFNLGYATRLVHPFVKTYIVPVSYESVMTEFDGGIAIGTYTRGNGLGEVYVVHAEEDKGVVRLDLSTLLSDSELKKIENEYGFGWKLARDPATGGLLIMSEHVIIQTSGCDDKGKVIYTGRSGAFESIVGVACYTPSQHSPVTPSDITGKMLVMVAKKDKLFFVEENASDFKAIMSGYSKHYDIKGALTFQSDPKRFMGTCGRSVVSVSDIAGS